MAKKVTPAPYMRFLDIPQLTRAGSWECDYELHCLWPFIEAKQRESGLNIDPDFQRAHVWTEAQQIAYLEFFLRGGKTGRVLYLNHPSWYTQIPRWRSYNDFVLVDGKQRLEAVRRFMHNEIRVFGSLFNEYTDVPRLATNTFRVNVNDLPTRAAVLQWYLEFNAGGTPHSEVELEHVRHLLAEEKAKATL